MKNQIIKTPTKGKECFGFTDTDLVVSSKNHKDMDALLGAVQKKGMLETLSHIPMANIRQLKYNENNALLAIKHQKNSKDKTFKLSFQDSEARNAIANSISEIKGLSKSFTPEGKVKPLLINIGIIVFAAFMFTAFTGMAHEVANGGEVAEFSGRRSGMKNLVANAAAAIGPIGVGIIGGLVVLALVWRAIKRWQNPANDVLFS